MAISTLCPGCQSLFRLPDELAGQHVRCQQCNRMLTVPGVLARSAKAPPRPPLAAPPPVPVAPPVAAPPALPIAAAPPETVLLNDGVPGVVLVEVPVKPAPPPLPEPTERPRQPKTAPRPAPTMTLSNRERPRRNTNRPRRPSSALAGLALGAMLLVFAGLVIVSGATWLLTEMDSQQPRQAFVLRPPGNGGFQPGGPIIVQPRPPMQGGGPIFVPAQPPPVNGAQGTKQRFNPGPKGGKLDDQRAIRLVLNNGHVVARQALTNNDPRDPVRRWGPGVVLPCKVFLVELEQGKAYTIDYQRVVGDANFDPYLRIEDLAGNRLVEHDDVAEIRVQPNGFDMHDMNSRIELHPLKTATYRIVCTLYQRPILGQMDFILTIRERPVAPTAAVKVRLPPPDQAGNPFNVIPATDKDLRVRVLTQLQTLSDLCWSADGKAVFALDRNGVLLKLHSDDLTEEGRLPLGRTPGGLALSSQGLVVTLPPPQPAGNAVFGGGKRPIQGGTREVWLIDPDTLQVKTRFGAFLRPEAGAAAVVSAPGLPYAFVASTGETSSYPAGYGVLALDLRDSRKPGRFYDIPNTTLAVSPRGDSLFVMDNNVLHRFAIDKETGALELKQTSHPYVRNGNATYRIDLSPDGKQVCVSGANLPLPVQQQHPQWRPSRVPVYAVEDLRKAVYALDTDMPVRAVGFDTVHAERVLSQTTDALIAVFDVTGKRRAGYRPPNIGNDQNALQFLVHPDGNAVLIRFEDRLCAATFTPNAGPVVVRNNPKFPASIALKDGDAIAGEANKAGDMTWRELQVPNRSEIDPVWDADGKALFHLDADGTLIRYRADSFTPTARLPLGRSARAIALSAQGLVVALRDQPEVWVIDAKSLQVVRAIVCPSPARYLACHPKQDRAVAVGADVVLLDLKQGRVAARELQKHADAGLPFQRPALTPDGKYVLLAHTSGGAAKVLRVKLEPDRLVVAETRSTPGRGTHAFCLTADGKQVAWYSLYGKGKQQPVEFYAIDNWKTPVATLPVSARAMAAADDGSVYVQTTKFELQRFARPTAKEGAVLRWEEGRVGIRELAVQPGRPAAFLASIGTRVLYGERTAK